MDRDGQMKLIDWEETVMIRRLVLVAALTVALVFIGAPRTMSAQQPVKEVSLLTTFGGSELDAMRASTDEFTKETGIQVTIESNRQSMPILQTRLAGGNPPDLALIPQPGQLAEFVKTGKVIPLVNKDGSAGLIDKATLTDNYNQNIIDLGTVNGTVYAILAKADSKSTIWYKPADFKAMGLEIPKTWDDLLAIQKKMAAAGKTPWSIGAGGDSWWTLTDWFEQIYLRINGPDMYQKLFATHQVPWTDDSAVKTLQAFQQIVSPATNLAGGIDGTLATDFTSAANLVFRPNAKAEMYYEGGFMGGIIHSNFPDLKPGTDFDAFIFPAFNDQYGAPITIGGDLLAAFANRPEVAQFVKWMAGTKGNTLWAKTGSAVSPNKNVPLSTYDALGAIDARELVGAKISVFDGSDQTPPAVAQQMGTSLQDFISNPSKLQTVLQDIENVAKKSYPMQ
jgi:alpha-glucoside transport system substrate-binding protein